MKSFDDLRTQLNEFADGPYASGTAFAVQGGHSSRNDIGDAAFMDKIQQYLDIVGGKPVFDPHGATVRLRAEMNIVGLDFPFAAGDGEGSYPVRGNAVAQGTLNPDGTFIESEDDGIESKLGHPLVMDVRHEASGDGRFFVKARLVNPDEDAAEE
jgi:hypothetical protein|tara:strand:- start:59 stop:523 length:465 start_codon:yes stop_codon:yes gene_type:complete